VYTLGLLHRLHSPTSALQWQLLGQHLSLTLNDACCPTCQAPYPRGTQFCKPCLTAKGWQPAPYLPKLRHPLPCPTLALYPWGATFKRTLYTSKFGDPWAKRQALATLQQALAWGLASVPWQPTLPSGRVAWVMLPSSQWWLGKPALHRGLQWAGATWCQQHPQALAEVLVATLGGLTWQQSPLQLGDRVAQHSQSGLQQRHASMAGQLHWQGATVQLTQHGITHLWLIDDLATTGATLSEGYRALAQAGFTKAFTVNALVLSATALT
jgi:predicted amidophosphoribosyltransferase